MNKRTLSDSELKEMKVHETRESEEAVKQVTVADTVKSKIIQLEMHKKLGGEKGGVEDEDE